MSGWMDSFNQAVGLTDDPADAQNKAIDAQTSAEDRRARLAEEQFAYQKSLSDPFFKASLPSYYSLVDAISGKRQSYQDPNYSQLTADEITGLNAGLATPKYDVNKTYYRSQNGTITDQVPMVQTSAFKPTETDAYKWQQSQMDKNTRRSLRSLGRENSTFGMNVIGDQNRNLAATEYDRQLGRLADLTNIARGGSSSLAGASAGFSNQQGQGITNQGNNLANAQLAGGMLKQNSLYNNQSNLSSLANLGIKAWDMYKNSGNSSGDGSSGGSSDWGSYDGTIDNYDANTTYAGDSPGPWAG